MHKTSSDIGEFERLLEIFAKLPKLKQKPKTLLEISGYPKFENVASNILEFFFSPKAEHGLGTVVLNSLLSLVDPEVGSCLSPDIQVEREVVTKTGKRLDIIAHGEELIAGIENKLDAEVYNDLKDYSDHLAGRAKHTGKPPLKIILCLNKQAITNHHGFKMISYSQFSESLLKNIGSGMLDANPRYLSLLLDFLNTIANLKTGTHMDTQIVEFFRNNEESAIDLYGQAQSLLEELQARTKELRNNLKKLPRFVKGPLLYNHPIDERCFYSTIYCDIDVGDGLIIVLETTLYLNNGWQIYAFPRKKGTTQPEVNTWLRKHKIPGKSNDVNGWSFADFPFDKDVGTVRAKYEEVLDAVCKSFSTKEKTIEN